MVSDADLARQAEAIARVRILGESAAGQPGRPETRYRVEVLEAIKGLGDATELELTVPGGIGPDGIGLKIWGSPRFAPGAEAILFLEPHPAGGYRSLHLMLGAFHVVEADGQRVAIRDLSDTREARTGAAGVSYRVDPLDLPRDADRFAAWLRTAGRGEPARPSYFLERAELPTLAERFSLLTDGDGHRLRWFDFDNGLTIGWQMVASGQPGLAGGGASELQGAISAWNADSGSDIFYAFSGTTGSNASGCASPSKVGKVIFGDPFNEISSQYSCGSGGVLAQAGPCFQTSLSPYNGIQYHPIVDGFVVTNDGIDCFFTSNPNPSAAAEELFGHELGHTLGLGHPSVFQALMFATLHNDGRGALLDADDRAGAAELYGNGSSPPPPPPPPPPPQPEPPAAPTNLAAVAQSSSEIRLTWTDNADDETSFLIERTDIGFFAQIAQVGANVTSFVDTGLEPSTTYQYRVRAGNSSGFSGFSNTAAATTDALPPPPPPSAPAAPTGLVASLDGTDRIELTWTDNAINETGYRVEQAVGAGGFSQVASLPAGSTGYTLSGLAAATRYRARVRAVNGAGFSPYSNVAEATTPADTGACVPSGTDLCLVGGKLKVSVSWRNQRDGSTGVGRTIVGSDNTGFFYFFNRNNVELVVKALDGRTVNGHYWLFYGALTDVEYEITLTELETGLTAVYRNPPGEICGRGDTTAIAAAPASSASALPVIARPLTGLPAEVGGAPASAAGLSSGPSPPVGLAEAACSASPGQLCLLGRFSVQVQWINQRDGGKQGIGRAIPQSDRTGFFWFFNPANIELVVKMLDARTVTGTFWFFYGALSDVEYRITVSDTETGEVVQYVNPPGEICGRADTAAF